MRKWLVMLALGIALVAVAAYSASGGTSHSNAGGTFRVGTSSRIDSLNPYVAFNQDAYSAFEYIYPLLIQYDKANSKFVADFATSWKTSNGGKTWTFKTRKGAKWTDGKPLTARDAAWSINTDIKYAATGAANAAGLIAHIKNAKAPNATTLVVNYAAPAGNVLGQFQQFAILPEHIWAKHTGHKGADLKTFPNNAPVVGGGPFKLTKFKKDQIALFERNGSFYGEKAKVDAFGLRMFSNDDALVSAMKAHDIDAIEDVPGTAIKILDRLGYKKGSDGIRTAQGHKMSYQVITPTDVPSTNRTFQILQPDFKKIGVKLQQRALDSTAAFDAISSPDNKYLKFDIA